ncbi:hypothetical protein V6N13_084853 [Hibiscus sabdariffa]
MQSAISPEDQSGPSAPKKRGRRDDDPPDPDATAMEIVAPVVFNPISYKDMLTGSTHLQPPGSIVDLDDDDIELLDDDVIIDRAIVALSIPNSFQVEADGFSGGIWLCCPRGGSLYGIIFVHSLITSQSCGLPLVTLMQLYCRMKDKVIEA